VYKEYKNRRPADCNKNESNFYLQPISKPKGSIWFSHQNMGKNTIGNIAKTMSIAAGLNSNKTNHSGRKTGIQKLPTC
jgi:hypothetical protein